MSSLRIFSQDNPKAAIQESTNKKEMANLLKDAGVRYEQWPTPASLSEQPEQDEILQAYKKEIDSLMQSEGYQTVDAISLSSDHPQKDDFRKKFLDEHTHSEDEVRFFVKGQGLFTLHIEDNVYEVLCTQGDLISVPANTPHWFDMGPNPNFIAIRLFNNEEGWVANFTGSNIAQSFNRLEN